MLPLLKEYIRRTRFWLEKFLFAALLSGNRDLRVERVEFVTSGFKRLSRYWYIKEKAFFLNIWPYIFCESSSPSNNLATSSNFFCCKNTDVILRCYWLIWIHHYGAARCPRHFPPTPVPLQVCHCAFPLTRCKVNRFIGAVAEGKSSFRQSLPCYCLFTWIISYPFQTKIISFSSLVFLLGHSEICRGVES